MATSTQHPAQRLIKVNMTGHDVMAIEVRPGIISILPFNLPDALIPPNSIAPISIRCKFLKAWRLLKSRRMKPRSANG